MRKWVLLFGVAVILIMVALAIYLIVVEDGNTLSFRVQDSVSKSWVWNFTARLQNRTIRGFYGSNFGLAEFEFTHLKPGKDQLRITAPSYEPRTIAVEIKRGKNVLEEPIEMRGYEIPGLDRFFIFIDHNRNDFLVELRPAGEDGKAIINHPCIDLVITVRISVQIKEGLPVQEPTRENSTYGEELFRGIIPWEWDPSPGTTFRYQARIPVNRMKEHHAPYRVFDFLIIVPDPMKISRSEVDALIKKGMDFSDPGKLKAFLDEYRGKFKYYINRKWNVPRP